MISFLTDVLRWWAACLFVVVAAAGATVYFAASGSPAEVAADPVWGVAKWFVLDGIAVGSLAMVAAALAYAGLRWKTRTAPKPRRTWKAQAAALLVALLLTGLLVDYVRAAHPILVQDVRVTIHPSSAQPDQVVLTWSEDPATTQTIQWRTSPEVKDGEVRWRPAPDGAWQNAPAESFLLEDDNLANDSKNQRHNVTLRGLEPATAYAYQAGLGGEWGAEHHFTTGPGTPESFSFVYMGDVQVGIEDWSTMVDTAYQRHPEAAFYVVAGDLVNFGGDRGEWDRFFASSERVFAERPIVPVLGNHDDDHDGYPGNYLKLFGLPENGPKDLEAEHAYSFRYGGVLFVVLDSNLDPDTQTDWLRDTLSQSQDRWKIVIAHHPFYASKAHRDASDLRDAWCPLLEEYGVHLVLQGHDHAYMRTFPMLQGKQVASPAEGVNYVVTVAGTKYYGQKKEDYMAVAFEKLSTYQVIHIEGGRLHYQAFDLSGKQVDELVIEL